jgi:hypothetical protein
LEESMDVPIAKIVDDKLYYYWNGVWILFREDI